MGHGVQNITFHCKNTAAFFNEARNSYRNGLKLLSWNDAELTPKGPHRLRYDAIEDGCKVSLHFRMIMCLHSVVNFSC